MRISDWSSDWCSSDLVAVARAHPDRSQVRRLGAPGAAGLHQHVVLLAFLHEGRDLAAAHHRFQRAADVGDAHAQVGGARAVDLHAHLRPGLLVIRVDREEAGVGTHALHHDVSPMRRSEEPRSELQSLMRISYAVSLLNTKKE